MRAGLGVLLVAGALLVASDAVGRDEKGTAPAGQKPEAAPESPTPREAPRVVVAVDPATGELRAPTAAEVEGLRAGARKGLSATVPPTRVETLSDGRVRARLGPEYFRFSVAGVRPDGTLSSECVAGEKAGAAVKTAGPATSAAKPAAEEK